MVCFAMYSTLTQPMLTLNVMLYFKEITCISLSLECLHIHDGHMCDSIQVFHHMREACEYA